MIGAKRIRLRRGMSRGCVGKLVGMSESAVWRLETGRGYFTPEVVESLTALYECSPDELTDIVTEDENLPKKGRPSKAVPKKKFIPLACKQCGVMVPTHHRCYRCEILIHKENTKYECKCGDQHGIMAAYNLCTLCCRGMEGILDGPHFKERSTTTRGDS